jgi:hypothetical protein
MLDDLYTALREDTLVLYDKETIAELRTFVRDKMGKLHGSPYDDRTISLAITVQMSEYAKANPHLAPEELQWGQGEWWKKQLEAVDEKKPMGYHNRRNRD